MPGHILGALPAGGLAGRTGLRVRVGPDIPLTHRGDFVHTLEKRLAVAGRVSGAGGPLGS